MTAQCINSAPVILRSVVETTFFQAAMVVAVLQSVMKTLSVWLLALSAVSLNVHAKGKPLYVNGNFVN